MTDGRDSLERMLPNYLKGLHAHRNPAEAVPLDADAVPTSAYAIGRASGDLSYRSRSTTAPGGPPASLAAPASLTVPARPKLIKEAANVGSSSFWERGKVQASSPGAPRSDRDDAPAARSCPPNKLQAPSAAVAYCARPSIRRSRSLDAGRVQRRDPWQVEAATARPSAATSAQNLWLPTEAIDLESQGMLAFEEMMARRAALLARSASTTARGV